MMKKTLQLMIALFTFTFASAQFTVSDINYTIIKSVADGDDTNEVEVSGSSLATVVVPSEVTNGGIDYTVTATGTNAFNPGVNGATIVETIELPSTVTSIGNASFRDAATLTTVSFTGGVSGVTNLSLRSFLNCAALTDVGPLLSTLQTTGANGTNGNGALNGTGITGAITLPSLTAVNGTSFIRAGHNITSVDLSASTSLTILKGNFIFDCANISEILLPEGLVTIDGSGLRKLPSLPSITLPSTVTTIGANAMTDNPLMQTVTALSVIPPTVSSSFGGTTDITTATLNVPAGSLSAYMEATGWEDFGTIQAIPTLNVSKIDTTNDATVSPNPVDNVINVEVAGENITLAVYDITGKLLLISSGKQANVSNLASGVYILKVITDNKEFVKRIIKN